MLRPLATAVPVGTSRQCSLEITERNNSERKRFCSNTFPLSIYYTCPNLPVLIHCQILAQLNLPGAAVDFFGHSWLIFTGFTWTAQPGSPEFADHPTWQSSTPCSLPGGIPFFFHRRLSHLTAFERGKHICVWLNLIYRLQSWSEGTDQFLQLR